MTEIYSLELEKHLIAGLLKFPKIYAEIAPFINQDDFYNKDNRTIFCVLRQTILSENPVDSTLVAQQVQNLGIRMEGISVFDYLEALSLIQVTEKGIIKTAQELKKYTLCRDIEATGEKLRKTAKESISKSPSDIITLADKIYGEKIQLYQNDNTAQDLFEGMIDEIERRGNNPVEETGIPTPYPEFNRLYGGLRPQNVYAFVARAGHSKSTVLSDICWKSSINIPDTCSLILDTEMSSVDIKLRIASAITGVNMWWLETGNWRKNEEMFKKVRDAWPKIKEYKGKITHLHVSAKPIEEISSIIRRWCYSNNHKFKNLIVAYDYIKLTGEKVNDSWKEYQAIGSKVDKLKQLSVELNIPILTACQLNRDAERGADDSAAIAQSDRLQWYCSFVGILRRKTVEEIAFDGDEMGSHKLIPLKTRFQGKNAVGHHDLVRIQENGKVKYKLNYLCYDVENFNVRETGSLRDIIARQTDSLPISQKESDGSIEV